MHDFKYRLSKKQLTPVSIASKFMRSIPSILLLAETHLKAVTPAFEFEGMI